jgi:hypothetical protein
MTHKVTVKYAAQDGTALKGQDYLDTSGTLVFEPGETAKTISVPVLGDDVDEFDEAFKVNLSGLTVGILSRVEGVCNIM